MHQGPFCGWLPKTEFSFVVPLVLMVMLGPGPAQPFYLWYLNVAGGLARGGRGFATLTQGGAPRTKSPDDQSPMEGEAKAIAPNVLL